MTGVKVSALLPAVNPTGADITYLVNAGSPRSLTLSALLTYLLAQTVVTTVNGRPGANGAVNITKGDIGLPNVPNVNPVTTLNALAGGVTIAAGNGISVSAAGSNITINVSGLTLPWGSFTGTVSAQTDLAALLASAGIQMGVRTLTVSTSSASLQSAGNFIGTDVAALWNNVSCPTSVSVNIPVGLGASVGALLEVRQTGSGAVTVTGDVGVTIFSPIGRPTTTIGIGTRMQLVCIGTDAWEYR